MNDIDFAKAIIRYRELSDELESLGARLEKHVSDKVKKTVILSGVQIKYYKPSKKPDYKSVVLSHPEITDEVYDQYSTVTKSVRWKEIVKDRGLNCDGFMIEGPARAVISIEESEESEESEEEV